MSMVMVLLVVSFGAGGLIGLVSLSSPIKPPEGTQWEVADNPTVPALEGEPAVLVSINITAIKRRRRGRKRQQCHREKRGSMAIKLKRQGETKVVSLRVMTDLRGVPKRFDVPSLDTLGIRDSRCPKGTDYFTVRAHTVRVGQSVMLTPGPVLTLGSFDDLVAKRLKERKQDRRTLMLMLVLFGLALVGTWHFVRHALGRGKQQP